jgi:1,4-dihydroxy-2-naphthoyl-CoA hydrolase
VTVIVPFIYHRRVHFQDTDAAGVVFFANIFAMCHEAYEASSAASGISLKEFFCDPACAVPIVESKAKFFRPMHCGDKLQLSLCPQLVSSTEFSVTYTVAIAPTTEIDGEPSATPDSAASAFPRHVAIAPTSRKRCPLPPPLVEWLTQWGE